MATTRSDVVRNREQLFQAARAVFAVEGPAAPLEAIATAAGVSRTTLHRHFPSREALIALIYDDNLDLILIEAARLRGTPRAAEKLLDFVLDLQVEMLRLTPLLHAAEDSTFDVQARRAAEAFELVLSGPGGHVGVGPGVDSTEMLLAVRMAESVMSVQNADQRIELHHRCRALLKRALFLG